MAIAADGYRQANGEGKSKLAGRDACAMADAFTGRSSRALSAPSKLIRHDRPTSPTSVTLGGEKLTSDWAAGQ